MQFRKVIPPARLRPFVKHFWFLDVEEKDIPFSQVLFPFGSSELIFNLDHAPQMKTARDSEMSTQPGSLFTGQFTNPFTLKYTRPFRCAGISFHAWTGNMLFGIPAREFTNALTPLEDIDKKINLSGKLLDAKSADEMLWQLEAYIAEKIRHYKIDPLAFAISGAILNDPSGRAHKEIISNAGFTRRRIEQRFLKSTGLPIGTFSRKVRFQKAVDLLRTMPHWSFTQVGLEAGYYDQAHFIREFRAFSGLSPRSFSMQGSEIQANVSDLMMVSH